MLSIVYYFIPLPEPLAVPSKWIIRLVELPPPFGNRVGVQEQTEDGLHRLMVGSLLFHQTERDVSWETLNWDQSVITAAAEAFPSSDSKADEEDYKTMSGIHTETVPQSQGWSTVVEAAIFSEPNADEDTLTEAFDYSLEQIRQTQQMYYMVSQIPVTLVTREALPMVIPAALREFDEENPRLTGPVRRFNYLVNDGQAAVARVAPPDKLSNDKLFQMSHSERLWPGPYATFINCRREMDIAQRAGNRFVAAVLSGASAEALLRELHLALMWDEGSEPRYTVQEMNNARTITRLARTAFHNRLGGNWSLNDNGPVADWKRHVSDLRNRVLHMGYEPDNTHIHRSLEATAALETFVSDRLAAVVHKYPFAAVSFLGTDRIQQLSKARRRAWERATYDFDGPNPVEAFNAWRHEVERLQEPERATVGNPTRGELVRVQYLNSEVRYWLADRKAGLGCLARPPDPSALNAAAELGLAGTEAERSTGLMHIEPIPAEDPPRWIPLREVIPSTPFRRFPYCLVPPRVKPDS